MTERGEAAMTNSETAGRNPVEEQLSRVHWHILRGDSLRSSVASRAGTLLSTNALVVAGIALAVGSGNHRPSGHYAADYCAYPVASAEMEQPRALVGAGFKEG